ncbi:glycosyltransferase family 4 protein [Pseudoalteromonas sp. Ld20]|uniref:glycosyltransferase family 4 protein n=1 Tax=Pseudoalteromonas sp. Ld20 TaxID=649165 RepID=UPI00386B3237
MKKLVIITTIPLTIETMLLEQVKYLSNHYKVILVTSSGLNSALFDSDLNIDIHTVEMARGIDLFRDFASLFSMIRLLKKIKPNLIHSFTPKAGLISMLAGFFLRTPVRVHTFTGLVFPTELGLKKKLLMFMDKIICFSSTKIIPEGVGVKNDLYTFGITKKTLNVIGHGNIAGVDTSFYSRQKVAASSDVTFLVEKIKLPKDSFVFCFVGRFTEDKGIKELLEALDGLPSNCYLLLVGEQDGRCPLNDEYINKIYKNDRIIDLGWLSDIRPALYLSDVLVLPSYREGFPNTPLQAGAMELPCIVTDINGCNEIIIPNYNGFIVPPRNVEKLKVAMLNSMDPERVNSMGINARKSIVEKFERKTHLKNMHNFYEGELTNEATV